MMSSSSQGLHFNRERMSEFKHSLIESNYDKSLKMGNQSQELVHLFKQFLNISRRQLKSHEYQDKTLYISELEPRDRSISVVLPEESSLTIEGLERYITELCKVVWSRAFYYYSTNQLNYQHTKIYSSQQILENLVRLSEKYHLGPQHFELINSHIQNKILEYMFDKYPMTLFQEINRNFNSKIREIDNTDQVANDYLYNSAVAFKYRENGQYNDLIMKSINEALRRIEFRIKNQSIYEKFEEKMENLFESVTDEDWMKEQLEEKNEAEEQNNNLQEKWLNSGKLRLEKASSIESIQVKKDQSKFNEKEKERYCMKVQQYTSYRIGRKLPESTRQFTEEQILSHNIKIQNPQVLRLLTKWCEELENKFTTPNYFEHYIETLKLQNGKFIILVLNEMKESLDQLMAEERYKIKAEIDELAKNNYFMQSELLMRELQVGGSNEIQQYEKISSKYSIDIVNNLHSYIIIYLNRLIHGLLTVAIKFTKLPVLSQIEWPSHINLITFQVMDLIRCKCASGEKEILRIYNELLKMNDQSPNLRIVRVSNRLKKGTHDVLINVRYHQVLCEIQLAVTSKNNKFIEYSNMFNHYLYELRRSVFGPLTELCSIWKCLDSRFNFYGTIQSKKLDSSSQGKAEHRCKSSSGMQAYRQPFICSNCSIHYYHNNFIKHHLKCRSCYYWLCAKCQINTMDAKNLLTAAYKNQDIIRRCQTVRPPQTIPQYGICIFVESQEIKIEPFRKYSTKNLTKVLGIKNKIVYEIFDISVEQSQASFREKFIIFDLGQMGRKHIKIDDDKIKEYLIELKLINVYNKNKETICLNHEGITNEQLNKLSELGSNSQKINVKRIEIIGNRLEDVGIISRDFKNVKTLEISKNNLINFEGIQKLQKLEKLYVNENKVKDLPIEVCHLWNLKQLSFCWNQIQALPDELSKLHKLRALKLSNNKIEQFPTPIVQLFYLNELNLKNNYIKEIPAEIGSLNELEVLELQNNQINTIHEKFGEQLKLHSLNLGYNQITQLPSSFTDLKCLSRCILRHNRIQQIKPEINCLQSLTHLDLSNNQISSFPALNSLYKLNELNLNYNSLTNIPSMTNCSSLRCLSLAHNCIKTFSTLYQAPNLEELYLNNNQIESIHQSLGKLERLQILHLQHNFISKFGDLRLQKVVYLNASYNSISSFCNIDLIGLDELDLSFNNIDSFHSNLLPGVKKLSLSNNNLEKLDLRNHSKLKYLILNNNRMRSLPDINEKNHLKNINLEQNQIKEITINIQNYGFLTQLNLAHNKLTLITKQWENFKVLHDKSLELSFNPIERVECTEWLLRKGTRQSLKQLSHLLSRRERSSLDSQSDVNKDEPTCSKVSSAEKIIVCLPVLQKIP